MFGEDRLNGAVFVVERLGEGVLDGRHCLDQCLVVQGLHWTAIVDGTRMLVWQRELNFSTLWVFNSSLSRATLKDH